MDITYSLCINHGINRRFNICHDRKVAKQGGQAFCCDSDHQHGRVDRKGQTGRHGQSLNSLCCTCFVKLAKWLFATVETGCHLEYFAAVAGDRIFCKRFQIIAYFYLTIFAYLLLKKNIFFFLSKAHLLGVLLFVSVIAIYLSFVLRWMTFVEYMNLWADQISQRGESSHSYAFLRHLISFPLDALLSFLPWTLFAVPVLIVKDLRMEAKAVYKNELFFFALVMVAANFPLYWLLKSARFRYFLPAGPFVAIGIATFLDGYLNGIQDNKNLNVLAKNFIRFLSWVALLSALAAVPAIISLKLGFPMPSVLLLISLFLLALFVLLKLDMLKLIDISVITVLFTALFFLSYTFFDIQINSKKENPPRTIAYQINSIFSGDVVTVYEIGYRQVLEITCYLHKEVIQLDNFSELGDFYKRGGQIYFIFKSSFLSKTTEEDRKFLQDHEWEKVYSSSSKNRKNEVIVGRLK